MFCYQCEQAAKGTGCDAMGVCGKKPEVADMQDLLIYALRGLAQYALEARKQGIVDRETDVFTSKALFSTLTNVNFDKDNLAQWVHKTVELRDACKEKLGLTLDGPAAFVPGASMEEMLAQAAEVGLKSDPDVNPDILSLQHILLFGIKGVAAYMDHAEILGQSDDGVYAFLYEALTAPLNKDLGLDEWVGLVLKCGEVNLKAMELLDAGNTGTYGHPVPTPVPLGRQGGQGHPGFGPRPQGPGRTAQADGRQGDQRLHPWGNAAMPRVSGAEKVRPLLRPLRHCMAKPKKGIRSLSGRHPHDHQLHPEAQGGISRTTYSPAAWWNGPA